MLIPGPGLFVIKKGWMDRLMDGWMDGWMDGLVLVSIAYNKNKTNQQVFFHVFQSFG